MDPEEFAARRRAIFNNADADLRPEVRRALKAYADGESDWLDEIVDSATVIWLETFLSEAPNANPDSPRRARFVREVTEALKQTDQPEPGEVDEVQVERVTRWLGTFTVNDATWSGSGARGTRNKRWTTMHDPAVRETHAVVDGQTRPIAAPFNVGGYELRFPGDPVGPAEIWINCRCVIQPAALRGELNVSTTTFAIVEEERTLSDEDLPVDDLEDDEEEITEIPVHGVLAPEGIPTGDGRQFGEGGLTTRNLPLPIAYQLLSGDGHDGSATVGRIDEVFREGNEMRFRGALVLSKEHTAAVIEGIIDGTVRGISVDVDDVEVDMSMSEESDGMDGRMPVTVFSHARIAGVTIVPIPAFQEAFIGLGHEFADELSAEALAACAACADEGPEDDEDNEDIVTGYDAYADLSGDEEANWLASVQAEDGNFRNYDAEARKRMAKDGTALPDGSFPIADEEDLRNAIQAIGRASDPAAAKAHIKKRARALGHAELIPEGWAAEVPIVASGPQDLLDQITYAPGTHDGPGWITHPIPTGRIRRYWVHGKGAAKIRWGTGGDFNRCRKQLAKYIANPKWLAGACANMHHEALGIWPATHAGKSRHALIAAGAVESPIFNLVASAGYIFDPNLFARVEMEDPRVGVEVVNDHVYGYVAQWGVCHIGIQGICTEAPPSPSDYWYYATGVVDTEEGPVRVGQITMDTGHAALRANAKVAAAHYDNTGSAVADIAVGEDAFGIWFSGRLRPSCTDEQRHALRASGRLSGDWREIGGSLELVAALAVNVPGFPIPHALAASANGVQTALVAAGIVLPKTEPAVTASADVDQIAGIVRASVQEYVHELRRNERAASLRTTVREKRIGALRAQIKEN